jgi:hypothetical protein
MGCYADRQKNLLKASKRVDRTKNPGRSPVENASIGHCGLDVAVAQKFLDRPYVVIDLENRNQ